MLDRVLDEWPVTWPPALDAVSEPAAAARWEGGLRPFYQYRDLGLAAATDGAAGARHVRTIAPDEPIRTGWHCHGLSFQFICVLQGSITLAPDGLAPATLTRGDCGTQPSYMWHDEYALSDDYEVVEITCPAEPATIVARSADLPEGGPPIYVSATQARWAPAPPLRAWHLGMGEVTGGRVRVRVLEAPAAIDEPATWPGDDAARFLFGLGEAAELAGHGGFGERDALCVPAGAALELAHCAAGFRALEVTLCASG